MEFQRATELEKEVKWGESAEGGIVKRWLKLSLYAKGAARVIKSADFDDYDFLLLDKRGLPIAYVEVKQRRTELAKYGDAMFPLRKHDFAKRLAAFNIPFLGVTQYGCGALVEVDLRKAPKEERMVSRRDRPGTPGVMHALYSGKQLTVLEAAK